MAQPIQPQDTFWDQLTAPFPPPPPFWKKFTVENVKKLAKLEESESVDAPSLPYDLVVLQPPPVPKGAETYTTFNYVHTMVPQPTLAPEHEELLFDRDELLKATGTARPHAKLLWQLTKSLNLNLLELFTIMADNPVDGPVKINDIGMLMENVNSILNLLRPHQAREQLKTSLLNQLDEGQEELDRCNDMKRKVEEFLLRVENGSDEVITTNSSYPTFDGINRHALPSLEKAEQERRKWKRVQQMCR